MISQLEQSRDKNIKKFTGTNPRKADNEIHTQPQVLPTRTALPEDFSCSTQL